MIIGITGHARHGKDSTADIIVKYFGYKKYALADVMKEACRIIFGWDNEHLYGDLKDAIDPAFGISPRHALQSLGTEWGQIELAKHDEFQKTAGRKLWVNSLLAKISDNAVISDVRFPHEAEAIRARGGIIIKVVRPFDVDLNHESERAVENIDADHTIKNLGSLVDLEWLVCDLMYKLPRMRT
jgi:rhodanese-related sulfurtransferase